MVQINWTSQALKDLEEIYNYISRDSKKYAKYQVIKIQAKTKQLKAAPKSGRIVPELANTSYRELIEGNYRIIYKVILKGRIDILTIHHSARDFNHKNI